MRKKFCLICLMYLIFSMPLMAKNLRIISYNLENLFDCENDSVTNDDSFTPEGAHQWTEKKYRYKLNNLSKAITAAGEWKFPGIIGLCEVENEKVVSDLIHQTQLKICGYQYVHKDSPDRRGVDVALLYQPQQFQLIQAQFLKVDLGAELKTRDILHATGLISNGDTLHIFVNHWPSRYGGELESQPKRNKAAQTLRTCIDSLFNTSPFSKIVIMGDFNDYPDDESLHIVLQAHSPNDSIEFNRLYNLAIPLNEKGKTGSHKFGGEWGMLDQIIVSGTLLKDSSKSKVLPNGLTICREKFLFKESSTGEMPKRAFLGTFFAYGFSDHLPVFIDLKIEKRE